MHLKIQTKQEQSLRYTYRWPGLEAKTPKEQKGVLPQTCHVTLDSGPSLPIFKMEGFDPESLGLTVQSDSLGGKRKDQDFRECGPEIL